ncbi:transcriptional adapter 2-beta isoform X1 [Patella vulgata]|uniref:transcriptional adapter 2-beta isoform X1 n=1 Tax=Patella vulgata TaxID=6465 RepID=UPI0021808BB3|nr:transcriptional adapter 2-beta isoform X1 [Patella vulgata]
MAKYDCTYCKAENLGYRIECTECPDFNLCLQCFSCGAEIGQHKKEHSYRIVNGNGPAAFDTPRPWSLAEEHMLLDAVEQYGFGNWEGTAGHVESRDMQECEDHYVTFYVQGNMGRETFQCDSGNKVIDHTCPDGGPLSPSITTASKPLELSLQEQHDLGYMPFRDDFEIESDNCAEQLVSGWGINYDDDELDIAVKISKVDQYRLRLRERERRKQVARDYGLIVAASSLNDKKNKYKKKMSKDERELQDKMKVFSQFHPIAEHEQMFENFQKEKELKSKIKELNELRKHGITLIDDIEDYEEDKYKREKKKENRAKMGSLTPKRNSTVSKKAEGKLEKLDILIDDEENKDEEVRIETRSTSQPGYDLISDREKKLCISIGMSPANYMTIKTCIIKDYLQRRQGLPVKIRYPNGMDKTHRRKIMSFLTDNGWIGVT